MIKLIIFLVIVYFIQIIVGKLLIKFFNNKEIKQPFLEEGPDHKQKKGTPTMGGITFIITMIISVTILLFINFNSLFLVIPIVIILYSLVGFIDDYFKVKQKNNSKGLKPSGKLTLQFLIAIGVFIYLLIIGFDMTINIYLFNTSLVISNVIIGQLIYFLLILFLFLGVTNATNLTDGLDGLLSSVSIISLSGFLMVAIFQNNLPVIIFILLFIAILFGFLNLNLYPAKIFMGDTGSIAIGALFVVLSIALHVELLLIYFGFIFILETCSVIVQVTYFKWTKRKYKVGKRLLLMAPLHHHFEKKKQSENDIIIIFCVIQFIANIIGIIIYTI